VIQTILFLAGINTLLQVHFGTRLPAVMGGSYTYIYPTVAIVLSPRHALIIDPLEVRATALLVQLFFSVPWIDFFCSDWLADRPASAPDRRRVSLQRFVLTMRSLQGALIIAGVFQAVIGFFGIWRVFIRSCYPPSVHVIFLCCSCADDAAVCCACQVPEPPRGVPVRHALGAGALLLHVPRGE
jgi:nucleobase transporter 1/2